VIRLALSLVALGCAGAASAAAPVRVPFVGCPSDGQLGPQPAEPLGRHATTPAFPAAMAAQLAFYGANGLGTLAPRGWHCVGLEGSNGTSLIVTPERHNPAEFLSHAVPLRGPAVQFRVILGGTSGRFEVARVIALAFPRQTAFARRVAAEGLGEPLPARPYSTDRTVRLLPDTVAYRTPAGRMGLGTVSRLAPGDRPIDGIAILTPESGLADPDFDVGKVDVRLPAAQASLATPILNFHLPTGASLRRRVRR
jgi:hypothetical protein